MSATTDDTSSMTETVKDYYGAVLRSSADLRTAACCPAQAPPAHLRAALDRIHDEVRQRSYGCGSPIPAGLSGATVLDLGCGTGQDCYLLSQLVGPTGRVIGVDMTEEQLTVARRHLDHHAELFGYANVEFHAGRIEDLAALGIEDDSIDVVVSNCVLNLSPAKDQVFAEIFRVLVEGGELYFSDVFTDRRVPDALRADPVLTGECLAGALYIEDFRRELARVGCADSRETAASPIPLTDPDIHRAIGHITFTSRTIRAFKLPLEDRCEDYGQIATYLGTLPEHPHAFDLDNGHRFPTAKPVPVCGNTADMLARTRYAEHFTVLGDRTTHHGLFDRGPTTTAAEGPGCC